MCGFGEDFELAFAFEPQLVAVEVFVREAFVRDADIFFQRGLWNLAEGDAHRCGLLRQRVLHRAEVQRVVAVAFVDLIEHHAHIAAAAAFGHQFAAETAAALKAHQRHRYR